MKLRKERLAVLVNKLEGVDSKTFHHTVRTRDGTVRLGLTLVRVESIHLFSTHLLPHEHVRSLSMQVLEVPEVVVCTLRLRHLVVGLRLACVDDIRELQSVLDEEHRNVVANNVPVAFIGVELERKPTYIADSVGTTTATKDCREALEQRCAARGVCQDASRGVCFQALMHLERAKCASTPCVDNALRDTFVIEAVDLLAGSVVLEKQWARVVIVAHPQPGICRPMFSQNAAEG